jgi:hypothetical protein
LRIRIESGAARRDSRPAHTVGESQQENATMTRIATIALFGSLMVAPLAMSSANAQPPCVGNRNMCDALNALQQARASLQRADSNKGGHRAQAIRSVDQAIQQVRNGIRYSNGGPVRPGRPDRPRPY